MFKLSPWLAAATLAVASTTVLADVAGMGKGFRTLMSNYKMVGLIAKECPNVKIPSLEPKPSVEKMVQNKLGIELYIQIMIAIQKSKLYENAENTINQLMVATEGCDDPRIARALTSIELEHIQAYARVKAEPALVAQKDIPVPMRR